MAVDWDSMPDQMPSCRCCIVPAQCQLIAYTANGYEYFRLDLFRLSPQAGRTMPHLSQSSTETLLSIVESVLQGRARNGFGLTGPALITAVRRGQPDPELERAYLELLKGDRAGPLILDHAETATAHRLFVDMLRSFVLLTETRKTELTGKDLVAAVRRYIAETKEEAVTEDEMALYLRLDGAMPRKKKRAA